MIDNLDPALLPGLSKKVAAARSNGWTVTCVQTTNASASLFVVYLQKDKNFRIAVYGPEQTKTWFKATSGYQGYSNGTTNVLESTMNVTSVWKSVTQESAA